jgi:hypothetical protein
MKEIFSEKVQINESLETVWKYFINFDENGAKWMNGISDMKVPGGGVKRGLKSFLLQKERKLPLQSPIIKILQV